MSRIYKWLAGALAGLLLLLGALLNVTQRQKAKAERKAGLQQRRADSAQERIDQLHRANLASKQAKEEGDARIDQVRTEARSGRRDHFTADRLRDDQ